jgi:hypothetical protein
MNRPYRERLWHQVLSQMKERRASPLAIRCMENEFHRETLTHRGTSQKLARYLTQERKEVIKIGSNDQRRTTRFRGEARRT